MKSEQSKNRTRLDSAEFYRRVQEKSPSLRRFALSLSNGNNFDAEDLMQDAFAQVFSSASDLTEIGDPIKYMYMAIKNKWIDKGRKEKIQTVSIDNDEHKNLVETSYMEMPVICEQLENRDSLEKLLLRLKPALSPLSKKEKQIMSLFIQGYSAGEIADELNEDLHKVRYELNAVRAKVRYRIRKIIQKHD